MAGEWGINDMRRRIAELEEAGLGIDVSAGTDALVKVGNELRVDIESLPQAPGT